MTTTPSGRPLPLSLSPRARQPGHSAGRRSGRRRLARALSWVLASFSLLILLGSGGGYLYVSSQFADIKSIHGLCLKGCAGQPAELGETENYLIVGTDTRSGDNSQGDLAGDGGTAVSSTNGNSDTTLLVHISADQKKVIVVSFPRDLLVERPAYTDAAGVTHPAAPQKFNAAFSLGGPSLLIAQVKALTHLPVDHYLSIDFSGFQSMVNALGGVTVCLSQDANDYGDATTGGSGFHATKGTHKLNGTQALMYVRQRHGLPGGDLDRIARQQRFIAALVRQAKQPSTLLNPLKLTSFISAITRNVTKDSGTSEQDIVGLVQRLKGLSTSSVEFNTVPISGNGGGPTTAANPNGEYLTINIPKAHTLFQAIFDDQDPANPPKPSAAPTPSTAVSAASAASAASPVPGVATTSAAPTTAATSPAPSGGGTALVKPITAAATDACGP